MRLSTPLPFSVRYALLAAVALLLAAAPASAQTLTPILFEAEGDNGTLGAEWATDSDGDTTYAYITTNFNANTDNPDPAVPQTEARVATYEVTFPEAASYVLYGRVYVGPGGFDDDSFLQAATPGDADPTDAADWVVVNGLAAGGFTDPDAVVSGDNGGGTLFEQWKWVAMSDYGGPTYTIEEGDLTQMIEIGGREDGLWFDSYAFGRADVEFTVSNLENGTAGTFVETVDPNVAVIVEAESGMLGADAATGTEGDVTYAEITSDFSAGDPADPAIPQTEDRVISYDVTFPEAGVYALYARVYVGPGGATDDSFLIGNGFGDKDPTVAADWVIANQLDVAGFTEDDDVVSGDGTAGSEVWKWVALTGAPRFNIPDSLYTIGPFDPLMQTFQIGGREDGLRFDKFAFAPVDLEYTVANLDNGEPGSPVVGDAIGKDPEAGIALSVAPNPVVGSAHVRFELSEAAEVSVAVYDVMGRLVTTLVEAPRAAGEHAVALDVAGLASGTYLARLVTDRGVVVRPFSVVR